MANEILNVICGAMFLIAVAPVVIFVLLDETP
jgi:hypothetical protein